MGARIELPRFHAIDSNGDPLSGGKLYTYKAGTTTPLATYSDRICATPNANPIILDPNGETVIFGLGAYKFILKDADDVQQWSFDNIEGVGQTSLVTIGDHDGDLDVAIDTIGATEKTLYIDQTATLSENKTAPSTLTLKLLKGGTIAQSTFDLTINGPMICEGGTFTGSGDLTINGPFECSLYQVFSGTGTVSFGAGKVREFYPQWWQENTTPGTTDMTAAIQAAIDAAIGVVGGLVTLASDTYATTDTLHLGRGNGSFDTVTMSGVATPHAGLGVTIDASSFLDRPAINIQGARAIRLSDMYVEGGNVAPASAGVSDVETDYITAGASYARYNPYAGVAIDGYSGSDPGATGYPGTYGMNFSSRVRLTNVHVKYFVIGVTNHPCNSNSQGDDIVLDQCKIDYCTYGFGVHGSQNRLNRLMNCEIAYCREGIITDRYGPQNGAAPFLSGGVWSHVYRAFDVGINNGAFSAQDVYIEGLQTIGNFGRTTSAANKTATFQGCEFKYYVSGTLSDNPPIVNIVTNGAVVFNGCCFRFQDGIFNIAGGMGNVILNACKFRATNTWNDQFYIGHTYNMARPLIEMHGCAYRTTLYSLPSSELNSVGFMLSIATPKRLNFTPASRILIDAYETYKYVRGANNNHISSAITGVTWTDVDTVQFTATTVAEFAEGDILFWKTTQYFSLYNYYLPAMKIVDITGSVVRADTLFDPDDYDKSWAPTTAYICQREWAPGVACTGDTHTNTTIDNVSDVTVLREDDFIKGSADIPANTRITDITGTTVTISKATTGTTVGIDLYFAQATAL